MTLTNILLILILLDLGYIALDISRLRKLAEREFKMKYNGP